MVKSDHPSIMSHVLQSGVSKVFSALLGPSLPQSPEPPSHPPTQQQQPVSIRSPAGVQPASSSTSASAQAVLVNSSETREDLLQSVVYPQGEAAAHAGTTHLAAPVMILPDLKAVLQWQQDCVQQIASQCCVHESVAVLLMDKHQGSAANACTAWANSPQGAFPGLTMPIYRTPVPNSAPHKQTGLKFNPGCHTASLQINSMLCLTLLLCMLSLIVVVCMLSLISFVCMLNIIIMMRTLSMFMMLRMLGLVMHATLLYVQLHVACPEPCITQQ